MNRPRKLSVDQLSIPQRIALAKKKTQRLVDDTIGLLALHEANRIVVYSPQLASQIPPSFAAHAFNNFQRSLYGFSLIRLYALWEECKPDDLDMESIPAVVNLIEAPAVLGSLQEQTRLSHLTAPTIFGLEAEPPEIRAAIEKEERAVTESWARQQSAKARAQLETAIRWTHRAGKSAKLEAIQNYRHKHLAHSLAATRLERRGSVGAAKYGYERHLIWKTVAVVNRLHLGVNGAGFSWKESVRIARKNAEALWHGCTFQVLE